MTRADAWAAPPPRSATVRASATRAEGVLLAVLVAGVVAATALVLLRPGAFDLPSLPDRLADWRYPAALAAYLTSHALRFLRLALLIQRPGLRLRRVLDVHLFTTALGVLLPFKLSELVRIRAVGVICGSWRTGLLAVWLERALDALVLAVLLGLAVAGSPDSVDDLAPALVAVLVFALLTLALATVVPANARELMLHVVRRRYGSRSLAVLRVSRQLLVTVHEAPRMLRGRLATLVLVSAGIWVAEIAAVSIALGLRLGVAELSSALLAVISTVSIGVTAVMPSAGNRLAEALATFGVSADVDVYRAVIVVVPLLLGSVAGIRRLRARREGAGW